MKAKPSYEELEKRIQVLEENENRVKEAEQELNQAISILNTSPVVAFVWQNVEAWPVLYVSENVKTLLGYSVSEFMSAKIAYANLIHPDDLKRVEEEVSVYSQNTESNTFKHEAYRIITKKGETKWVDDRTVIFRDNNGNITHYQGVVIDITQVKNAENKLKKNETLLNTVESLTKVGGWEWNVLNKTMYWTNETYKIHEIIPSEIKPGSKAHIEQGANCYDPDDQPIVLHAFNNCVNNGTPYDLEFPFTTVKGKKIWIRTTAKAIEAKGKIVRVIGNIMDITERKLAEKEIKRFSLIFENSLNEIYLFNANNLKFIQVNDAALKNLGYSIKDLIGRTPIDIKPEITEKDFTKLIAPLLSGEKEKIVFETVHQRKDKSLYHVEVHLQLLQFEKELIFTAIILDISDRKKTEKALIESEEKFRSFFEMNRSIMLQIDPESMSILNANSSAIDFYKYNKGDLLKKSMFDLNTLPKNEIINLMKSAVQKNSNYFVFKHQLADKRIRDVEIYASPIKSRADRTMLVAIHDITERKVAEQKLVERNNELFTAKEKALENQKKLSSLIQKLDLHIKQTPMAVIDWNLHFKVNSWNKSAEKIFGYSENEAKGKHASELILPANSREQLDKVWTNLIKNRGGNRNLNENRTKNGKAITCDWYNTPLIDNHGKVVSVTSLALDVTDQQKAEQALKESELKYRTIVENISEGLVVIDKNGEYLSVNSAYYKMHGYTLEEILDLNITDLFHESNSINIENYNEFIVKNGYLDEDMIGCHKNGSKVFVHVKARVFDYNGKKAVLTIVSDISVRKKMEQQILKSIIQTEEKERARYAKELHDGLGPIFSTVKLYFQWLTETEDPDKRKFIIDKGNENIQEAITTLSEISNNLNPHVLVNYGLIEAVQIFIEKLAENKLTRFIYETDLNERFSKEIEITLYRVITELINNTIKYAEATEVIIKLAKKEKKKVLSLNYQDNGIGFNIKQVLKKKRGLGIFNIKSRIKTIGGNIDFTTEPGKGLKVKINVNLEGLHEFE